MKRTEFEKLIAKHPTKQFCLHNGFSGFAFGCPSNPKWISFDQAYELLSEYENLTGIDPISDFDQVWHNFSLLFEKASKPLESETGFRMMGFNNESECIYSYDGRLP